MKAAKSRGNKTQNAFLARVTKAISPPTARVSAVRLGGGSIHFRRAFRTENCKCNTSSRTSRRQAHEKRRWHAPVVANDDGDRRRAARRSVSHGGFARVLLRSFGRSRLHDCFLHRENHVVTLVNCLTA